MCGRCRATSATRCFFAAHAAKKNGRRSWTCVRKLGIKFPAVIDGFDNHVETAYTGWPDRLYLVAPVGAVIYKSKPGPFGFHPDDLAAALKRTLGTL